jgi:DNA (cytosine-5)-methyltransferase 1
VRIGSLFTGCAGLDLAIDGDHAWMCENDPHCRKVLEHRFPRVPIIPDVREIDAGAPPVDMLAGGFPCQDLSHAGNGKGFAGDRSALWFAFADAIRVLRPRWVLVENVPGIFTKMGGRPGESAFATVIADLAEAGYMGSWRSIRASDVGAPHRRERVFILASHTDGAGAGRNNRAVPNAMEGRAELNVRAAVDGRATAADTEREWGREEHQPDQRLLHAGAGCEPTADAARTDCGGSQHHDLATPTGQTAEPGERAGTTAWGVYESAIRRWEHTIARTAPRPTDDRGRLNPVFVEWLMGLPEGWVTDPDLAVSRTQQLRILGNAVVPAQAALAIRLLT